MLRTIEFFDSSSTTARELGLSDFIENSLEYKLKMNILMDDKNPLYEVYFKIRQNIYLKTREDYKSIVYGKI